jgi:hypothetical protein
VVQQYDGRSIFRTVGFDMEKMAVNDHILRT